MDINENIWNDVSSAAFRAMLDNSQNIIFVKDIDLKYVACSRTFARMAGYQNSEAIIGLSDYEVFKDKSLAERYVNDDKKLISSGENLIDYIEPLTDIDGHARYSSTSKYILKNKWGHPIGLLGISRDITREYSIQQHHNQELRYLFELPSDTYASVFIDVQSWRIIAQRRQNIGGASLPSCNSVEELKQLALEALADNSEDTKIFYAQFSKETLIDIYKSGRTGFSLKYKRLMTDGSVRWIRNDMRFLTDPESGHLCVMLSAVDIDAEKLEEQEMLRAAETDELTGLYNRKATFKHIQTILDREHDSIHALIMIDIDNFKLLNDTLGHRAGDEFLVAFSNKVKNLFREGDIFGRIGGDEFFVLLRCVSGVDAVKNKTQTLLHTIQSVCADYPSIGLSASVGVSFFPRNGKNIENLYAKADSALYVAKMKGKNQCVLA